MKLIWDITFFFSFFLFVYCETSPNLSRLTYDLLYKSGVDAYLQNRWQDCIAFIEKSLEDYFFYTNIILECRQMCSKNRNISITDDSLEDLEFWKQYHVILIERAICLMKCQKSLLPNHYKIHDEIDSDFQNKVPYNYLQLCYFKNEELEKAASCAYTFLIHNPGHEVMQTNLRYYMSVPKIKIEKIKYLEPKDYQDLFLKGAQLYTEKKYTDVINVMEKSLEEYLTADELCRLHCEGLISGIANELYISLANNLISALKCKLNCSEKLAYMYGQKHENLFSLHYHYLQFSYFKVGKLQETCSAVASYLMLNPKDEVMKSNYLYYSKIPGVSKEWFQPRKEVKEYNTRYQEEKNLIEHFEKIEKENVFPMPPPSNVLQNSYPIKPKYGPKRDKDLPMNSLDWLKQNGISTLFNENQLNGTSRIAFKDLITHEECKQLVDMATDGAIYGDGYNGKESPHTEFEMFEGLTITRAAALTYKGLLNPLVAELFLNISEKARHAVEVYFDLETELYFAYTHLVCRTALPGSPEERDDLSHPIHADNCILTSNGKCLKEKPAYIWRDYSSIIYLNEDFEGGEFIFAKNKASIQATLKPKCGLMVAFSAGQENLHGVKAVKKGRRCALAMWYTLDSRYKEKERDFAFKIISGLKEKRQLLMKTKDLATSNLLQVVEKKEGHHQSSHSEL